MTNTVDLTLPVELDVFNAKSLENGIELNWITQSEVDNAGFILERKCNGEWQKIADYKSLIELTGQGTSSAANEYCFVDKTALEGETYTYRLSSVSIQGVVEEQKSITFRYDIKCPETTRLYNAYPNPFNPSTALRYALATDDQVELDIFDINGRHVISLVSELQAAGEYESKWDGADMNGHKVASGTYIARLKAGNFTQTNKLVYIQ